jgi:hypothetical protein
VLQFWNALLEGMPQAEQTPLRKMITVSATGLKVALPPELDRLLREPERQRARDHSDFKTKNGSIWRFHATSGVADSMAKEISEFLSLAHDIQMDEMDVDPTEPSPSETPLSIASMTWGAPFPGASRVYLYQGKAVHIDWLVPRWSTYLDWRLTLELWNRIKGVSIVKTKPEAAALAFLSGLGAIAHHRKVVANIHIAWIDALNLIHSAPANILLRGTRWERFKEWAEIGAVLFAAPELGLSVEDSSKVLEYLCPSIESDRRARIVAARRVWAQRSLRLAGLEHDDAAVSRFLSEMDGLVPDHPWHEVIGTDASPPSAPSSPA